MRTVVNRRPTVHQFTASVETGRDGWCTIWVAELRGLYVNMSSAPAATRALRAAVTGYLQWLERHGELPDPPDRIALSVAERHRVETGLRWGGYHALHAFEVPPVTQEEVNRALRWMGCMRQDTVRLIEALPRKALDWRRPAQDRTIREYLYHVARGERWYLERLGLKPYPPVGTAVNPVTRLSRLRSLVGWRLLRLTPEECERVVETDGQWWSVRKMLGRYLYHERYHLRSIARIARHHHAPVPQGLGGWPRY